MNTGSATQGCDRGGWGETFSRPRLGGGGGIGAHVLTRGTGIPTAVQTDGVYFARLQGARWRHCGAGQCRGRGLNADIRGWPPPWRPRRSLTAARTAANHKMETIQRSTSLPCGSTSLPCGEAGEGLTPGPAHRGARVLTVAEQHNDEAGSRAAAWRGCLARPAGVAFACLHRHDPPNR
jgi:hypothetical protein